MSCDSTNMTEHPVEPGFDLLYVAQLIPCRPDTLRRYLSDHKADYPARYRFDGAMHRRMRVLLASEVRALRDHFVRSASYAPQLT